MPINANRQHGGRKGKPMKYVAIITRNHADGTQTTIAHTINADSTQAARAELDNANAVSIRIYPSTDTTIGIMRGALMVARRTAVNAIMRQGTTTQHTIERETAAINARLHGCIDPIRINTVIAEYSGDTQEFYACAVSGLCDGVSMGLDIAGQYRLAYKTLNAHIHSQRAATEHEISTEYIVSGGGDLVAINTAIAAIIRGGDKWTAAASGNMDAGTAARLGNTIHAAMLTINPTQRRIAELLARGYSQRRIAEMTGRELATVNRNIAIMRDTIAAYIRDNASEFADTIKAAETAAAAKAAAKIMTVDRHTDASKAAAKATQAERARRYRARKAAETENK